ncbi:unnamed protein product [Phaedon cochleariae]|uniref:Fibronectin type-III domain-containing protein n=1 Tax=Phaedon cochleariae TaxID=80249 RepID=A0A9N9SHF4_PHACE|nr:unnamed protein product [Phaedon cochleariae]
MAPLRVLVVLLGFLQESCAAGRYARYGPLVAARCEVRCWTEKKNTCMKACLKEVIKPGSCPYMKSISSTQYPGTCERRCWSDSNCQGVSKCCHQSCGVNCQLPVDLDAVLGLPDIPKAPRVIEKRKKKMVIIDWSTNQPPQDTLYLLEERHHTGKFFSEKNMSDWRFCFKLMKPRKALRHFVKPGRWYQFRVAAVNRNGTRGYSNSSLPFRVFTNPKPPKAPDNVTVEPLVKANGSLSTTIRWTPPVSDLPILKYRVFWSRRIYDSMALDSVLIYQQIVPKTQTYLQLQNLQPNSLYFLQVQALVQFGVGRLKGEKSGLVLNTTSYINEDDNALVLDANNDNLGEVQLLRLAWQKGNLQARVVWKHPGKYSNKYRIKWWSSPGQPRKNRLKAFKQSVTIKGSHFDISDLQFDCQYRISIKYISKKRRRAEEDAFISFTTPTCSVLQKSLRRLKCS